MNRKHLVLGALSVVSFVSGGIDQYFYPGVQFPPSALGYMVVMLFLIFTWYHLDSRQHGYRRSPWLDVGVVALSFVALPYYFFRTRGAWRGLLATGTLLLAYVASALLAAAGAFAVYYGVQV